jgi:hypothetical protein
VHTCPDSTLGGLPYHDGALHSFSKENELRLTLLSYCDECGGQLMGV